MITTIVIPCYKVKKQIKNVILGIPEFINHIIIVDDKCPEKTGKFVEKLNINKTQIIFNKKNLGVGGATITGILKAIDLDSDIIIKMDGDGQMDPKYLSDLIEPVKTGLCDYSKGNRLYHTNDLKRMPLKRLIGNNFLSFLVKFSSGYWNISDPNNGYLCFSKKAARSIPFDRLSKRYFFETDVLINLNIKNCVIKDIQMPAKYEDEVSSMSLNRVVLSFPFLLLKGLIKRILFKYYIYDFNICSLYLISGIPLFTFGMLYGLYTWSFSVQNNLNTPTGTIMIIVICLTFGFQLLLQAITYDIFNTPKKL